MIIYDEALELAKIGDGRDTGQSTIVDRRLTEDGVTRLSRWVIATLGHPDPLGMTVLPVNPALSPKAAERFGPCLVDTSIPGNTRTFQLYSWTTVRCLAAQLLRAADDYDPPYKPEGFSVSWPTITSCTDVEEIPVRREIVAGKKIWIGKCPECGVFGQGDTAEDAQSSISQACLARKLPSKRK